MPFDVVVALSKANGTRLAELGFVSVLGAGVGLIAAEVRDPRQRKIRRVIAGSLLVLAGLALVVATHWGHYS